MILKKANRKIADLKKHIQQSRRAEERLFFFVQLHGHWFWAEVLACGPRGTQSGLPHHLVYASLTVTWPCLTTLWSAQLMLRLIMASFPRTTCADFFTTLGWQCFYGLPFHCEVKSTAHTGVMTSSSCFNILNETVNRQSFLALINSPFSVSTHSVERDHAHSQTHKMCEFLDRATLKNKQMPTCCIHQNTHCHVCSCDRG